MANIKHRLYMSSLLSLFLCIVIVNVSNASSHPTLVALNCTSLQTSFPIKPRLWLDHLTSQAQLTRFATFKTNHSIALMQCRLDLNQPNCSSCIKNAQDTIFQLCPNSHSVAAWFDGCYLGYSFYPSYDSKKQDRIIPPNASNISCSTKSVPYVENAYFAPALETLLLNLRAAAAVSVEIRHGFSHGELSYGKHGRKIYGMVECLRILSEKECSLCLKQGIEGVEEECGSRMGGAVVKEGQCIVWFESSNFLFEGEGSMSTGSTVINVRNDQGNDQKLSLLVWGIIFIGVVFLAIVGACGCLLRRSILIRVGVLTDNEVECDKV